MSALESGGSLFARHVPWNIVIQMATGGAHPAVPGGPKAGDRGRVSWLVFWVNLAQAGAITEKGASLEETPP